MLCFKIPVLPLPVLTVGIAVLLAMLLTIFALAQ